MLRIFRIFKTFTSLMFIGALLLTYSFTVNQKEVFIDMERMTVMKVEHLFFYALGVFIFFNLLFLLFDRTLINYRNRKKKFSNLLKTEKFQSWLSGFSAAVNIFLASAVIFVGFLNSENYLNMLEFTFILYVGPVAILIALFTLPLVFIPGKKGID